MTRKEAQDLVNTAELKIAEPVWKPAIKYCTVGEYVTNRDGYGVVIEAIPRTIIKLPTGEIDTRNPRIWNRIKPRTATWRAAHRQFKSVAIHNAETMVGSPTPEDKARLNEELNVHVEETFGALEADPNGVDQHAPGAKLDAGKPQASLLADFGRALTAVAEVGTHGAAKYSRGGWKEVPDAFNRYSDAMWRHMLKEATELHDADSNLTHAAHSAWNALARLEFLLKESN